MHGILLLNIGTPESAKVRDVRKYLREFLSDPRVVNLPGLLRFLLLNFIILPTRSGNSAAAYRSVWTEQGSPLMVYSMQLKDEIAKRLPADHVVSFGMRYGEPSIKSALQQLSACEQITVLPLFPQYSSAATGSAIAEVMQILQHKTNIPTLNIINNFYGNEYFIAAFASNIKNFLQHENFDHVLFSFHGLPEAQVAQSCDSVCARADVCPAISAKNKFCYRAQCFATSRALAASCQLASEQYSVSFQSRLGKLPWIRPYTDEIIKHLYASGVRKLLVVCPAFVTDCLETLEEIALRLKDSWLELGGQILEVVPCLNADAAWVDAIFKITKIKNIS
jgi:ferrochelatase